MTYLPARITVVMRSALSRSGLEAGIEDSIKCFDLATLISAVPK
jgi:hypothetical protein